MEQTTNLKEFLTEIAEAIRIKREEYDELYSPQEFAEKILDIEKTNIETGTIQFIDGDSEEENAWITPPIIGLENYYAIELIDEYRDLYGSAGYDGHTLPYLVENSLLLVKTSPSYISIDGPSRVVWRSNSCFVVQVKSGLSTITLYYNTGADE